MKLPGVKIFTKEEVRRKLGEIKDRGWIELTKHRQAKDGGIGNNLEDLIGIQENNLQIADLGIYELKTHRKESDSLISLKRQEPGPGKRNALVPKLVENYGWDFPNCDDYNEKGRCKHLKEGGHGRCYPPGEKSLRIDMDGKNYSERGFKIVINRECKRIIIDFNPNKVKLPDHQNWLANVTKNVGEGYLDTRHHWPFNKIESALNKKMKNMVYVIVDEKEENGRHFFKIVDAFFLEDFNFNNLLEAIENGDVQIEFNARTHHNHGTAFRTWERNWTKFYDKKESVF